MPRPSEIFIVRFCLRLFPSCPRSFLTDFLLLSIILVSASSDFTLTVPMCEVCCVGYTPLQRPKRCYPFCR